MKALESKIKHALEDNGINAYGKMEPAAKRIVELVKGGN